MTPLSQRPHPLSLTDYLILPGFVGVQLDRLLSLRPFDDQGEIGGGMDLNLRLLLHRLALRAVQVQLATFAERIALHAVFLQQPNVPEQRVRDPISSS